MSGEPTIQRAATPAEESARQAAYEILQERDAAREVIQAAIRNFEERAEGCREIGTPSEPFDYAAEYLRAKLTNMRGNR